MVCIYCGGDTQVANSRPQTRLYQTWRRRRCKSCGAIFTTIEMLDLAGSLVVRNADSTIEPFNRDRLFVSVLQAVGHRNDPLRDARAITDTITGQLLRSAKGAIISPSEIIDASTRILRRFDKAASVHYAAYHKH